MANRFQKNHPPIDSNDPAMLLTAGIREEPKEEEVEVVVKSKPVEKEKDKVNPLAGMLENKQEGKSYGFYLSNEAASKLEKLAKQNKCSKSKALDTLLRSIL